MVQQLAKNEKKYIVKLFRSPTLDTVSMVEKTIEKFNGEFKKTQLWGKLPRKIMWSTYLRILCYLEEINKIIISENGIVNYIWDPEGAKEYLKKRHLYHYNVKTKKNRKTKR